MSGGRKNMCKGPEAGVRLELVTRGCQAAREVKRRERRTRGRRVGLRERRGRGREEGERAGTQRGRGERQVPGACGLP